LKASVRRLQLHRRRYFSQSGEDGLLDYLLQRIAVRDRWCVEFGAWDGRHLSNCYHLIADIGYRAVLIELDADRCAALAANMAVFGSSCLNREVGYEGEKKLDAILAETPIPHDFDLLSIDIDSDDYRVWQALEDYSPKIVVIEINIRDLPGVERINVPGSPTVWGSSGSSITSLTALATEKGYSLVAMVGCNAIYVRHEFLHLFHPREVTVKDVFTYEGHASSELTLSQRLRKFEVMLCVSQRLRRLRVGWSK